MKRPPRQLLFLLNIVRDELPRMTAEELEILTGMVDTEATRRLRITAGQHPHAHHGDGDREG